MADDRLVNGNLPEGVAESRAGYGAPLPEQKGFFKIPARFGHVPVAAEPLGYDKERRFEHHYPRIELPFQVVDVVKTGAEKLGEVNDLFPQGRNRLFFGDCLHVMRMLPSESIDLIYIDPPFFSGRNYNILYGDKNEVRSFSDIWEGGMPGYLIWLNARLYEMKRLLKPTGSIYVHLDWHAVHYVKVEMDKIFGHENFQNEIVWYYRRWTNVSSQYQKMHDVILYYRKGEATTFNLTQVDPTESQAAVIRRGWNVNKVRGPSGKILQLLVYDREKMERAVVLGRLNPTKYDRIVYRDGQHKSAASDTWTDIQFLHSQAEERIGYPTQKPEALLERIIEASSNKGDIVADFFCGGGTTPAVAQRLGRRWIGSDISRVAVALTADRIARIMQPALGKKFAKAKPVKMSTGNVLEDAIQEAMGQPVLQQKAELVSQSTLPVAGYSVEHWGIYEINRLTKLSSGEFREFALRCYGARKWTGSDPHIHGVKGNELLWVAGPKETDLVTPADVKNFAQAVMKSRKPEERQAVMIGWAIDPKAKVYAEQVMALGDQKPIQFIKLRLWPLAGEEFKAHVTKKHDKYKDFFAFILPPDVPRIGATRLSRLKYRFDVSEARSMNTGGKIVNVQWDFDFREGIFSATQGYSLCRKEKKGRGEAGFEGEMAVEYVFEDMAPGTEVTIACRVQDDLGGEGMKTMKMRVE